MAIANKVHRASPSKGGMKGGFDNMDLLSLSLISLNHIAPDLAFGVGVQ